MDLTYGAASISQRGDMQHVTYQEFNRRVSRSGLCVCGKRRTRSTTFTETVNPFNRDPETGVPKTAQQVRESLNQEVAEWVPDFTCTSHEYVAITAHVVGNPDSGYETVYNVVSRHRSRHWAQTGGMRAAQDTDDFLIGVVEGGHLITVLNASGARLAEWSNDSYRSVADGIGMTWG
jgi:hypothetical protein